MNLIFISITSLNANFNKRFYLELHMLTIIFPLISSIKDVTSQFVEFFNI